jgi:hypothetical protein
MPSNCFLFTLHLCARRIFLAPIATHGGSHVCALLRVVWSAVSTRLKSVKSIEKITKSMKMVSAAKLAKAQKNLELVRPIGIASKGE